MKTCLVLGAGGFIGKNLCMTLAKDHLVIAFDRYMCEELQNIKNIRQIIGDFAKIVDFSSLLSDIDVVYHLISTTLPAEGTDDVAEEMEENIVPTLRLLSQMAAKGKGRIIFASSGGTVYGERNGEKCLVTDKLKPQCTYGVQKQVIETYLDFFDRCTSLTCITARLANPYGMGQDIKRKQGVIPIFVYNILCGLPITVRGDGTYKRDYINMDDMINALVLLSDYSGKFRIFNIGTGESHSLLDVIGLIEKIAGCNFKKINYIPNYSVDVSSVCLDIEQTKKELGWRPEISLEMGIEKIIKNYRELIVSKSYLE